MRRVRLEDLHEFAAQVAKTLRVGCPLFLEGDLGAGKTTLARHIIQELCKEDLQVQSPTFPIMLPYEIPAGELWHMDLYRLEGCQERIQSLDVPFYMDNYFCIIEWPQFLGPFYQRPCQKMILEAGEREDERFVRWYPQP